ncbi:MAG: TetR/AcrR family transcriptional regulator [Saprospiraceae bacterium]|nr:TetR/AcrR family transcriptional regulator [Saprospiraceae bacterium]
MSPRSKEQLEIIRSESKAKILDAALHLFSQKGYAATTVSAIAQRAGVSKGLLYNYFSGKNDLLHGIVHQAMDIGEEILQTSQAQSAPPHQILCQIIDGVFFAIDSNRPFWKLLFQLTIQEGVMDMVKDLTTKQQAEQLRMATAIFEDMGIEEPSKEAYLFAAILDGMALQYVALPQEYPLQQQIQYLKERYVKK